MQKPSIKALARKVLERNRLCNSRATTARNLVADGDENRAHLLQATENERRYPYRFKLRDGGGTYLTPAKTLGEAKAALQRRYGEDLLLVTTGSGECQES